MKSINDVESSIRDIKTARVGGLRAAPKVKGSAYLEFFMLSKEKEKLEKEEFNLEKRKAKIQKRFKEIAQQTEILEETIEREEGECFKKKKVPQIKRNSKKDWKTINLGY